MAAAKFSLNVKPIPFTQGLLNDLVYGLGLSKELPEILASRIGEHGVFGSDAKVAFYRSRDDLLIRFFFMENDFVYGNNIQSLLSETGLPEYNPDEWRLTALNGVGNVCYFIMATILRVPTGHSVIVKEHYLNVKIVLQKLCYS